MRTVLPLSCALAILAAAPDPLPAQEKILRAFPLNPDGAVRIFNDAGAIRVIGWDKDSVVITGTLARGAQLFGGGGYEGVKFFVEGPKPGASAKMAGVSDLVVRLPARARGWLTAAPAPHEGGALAGPAGGDGVAALPPPQDGHGPRHVERVERGRRAHHGQRQHRRQRGHGHARALRVH